MKTITSTMLDEAFKQVMGYAETHFGAQCGADFPEFATKLFGCEAFRSMTMAAVLASTYSGLALKGRVAADRNQTPEAIFSVSRPLAEMLAQAVYTGVVIGSMLKECDSLEKLIDEALDEQA